MAGINARWIRANHLLACQEMGDRTRIASCLDSLRRLRRRGKGGAERFLRHPLENHAVWSSSDEIAEATSLANCSPKNPRTTFSRSFRVVSNLASALILRSIFD
jgi:hypothetical protein